MESCKLARSSGWLDLECGKFGDDSNLVLTGDSEYMWKSRTEGGRSRDSIPSSMFSMSHDNSLKLCSFN